MGIKISKRLREELTQHSPIVALVQRNPLARPAVRFTVDDYITTLKQFPMSKIELSIMGGVDERHVVVEVLSRAAATAGLCTNIVHLDVYNHGLADERSIILSRFISKFENLRHLSLDMNFISCPGAVALCGVLGNLRFLENLSLCNNSLGLEGVEALGEMLGKCNALSCLRLEVPTLLAMPIAEGIRSAPRSAHTGAIREARG